MRCHCTVLYCNVRCHCSVLYCNVSSHCSVLYCNVSSHCSVLYCNMSSHCSVLYCNVSSHCSLLYYNVSSHWSVLYCNVSTVTSLLTAPPQYLQVGPGGAGCEDQYEAEQSSHGWLETMRTRLIYWEQTGQAGVLVVPQSWHHYGAGGAPLTCQNWLSSLSYKPSSLQLRG